jgi:hypothetical protein
MNVAARSRPITLEPEESKSMTDTEATFIEWLDSLLAERRQLVQLLQTRQRAKILAETQAVKAAEDRICELILDSLDLAPADTPHPAILVNAIASLPARFGSLPMVEAPELVFNDSLTPGYVFHPVPALKDRLLDLTCDLDSVIAHKKAA